MIPPENRGEVINASWAPVASPPPGALFTWEQAVRVLRKNRRFALLFTGIVIAAVVAMAMLMKDVYRPLARLEIDQPSSGIKTLHEIESAYVTDDQDYLETQAQILQSDALAISVIRTLHLDQNPEFVPKKSVGALKSSQERAAQVPSEPSADATLEQEEYSLANHTPEESVALGAFRRRLSVNAVRDSRLIEVGFSSHDPRLAQTVTNTLVDEFINRNYRNRYRTTMQASEWLSSQIEDLRQHVEESNRALVAYQKQHGLVETDDRNVPGDQLMDDVNRQFSDAEANRIEAEAYIRMIDLGQSDAIPAVRDDPVYQNLMTHFADVRAQLAQARAIYGDENSNVKKIEDESNELAAQLEAERARVVNQVRTSYAAAREREEMMRQSREKLRTQMGDVSSQMVEYRMLKNEATANADLYNTLQARLKEAGIYAGLGSSNIHIVDLAPQLDRPTGPDRRLIISVGVLIACLLGIILSFVRESLNNTVRTPDDVKEWTGLSSLAIIPTMNGNGSRKIGSGSRSSGSLIGLQDTAIASPKIFATNAHTAEGEALRNLRATLMLSRAGAPPRVILVSSAAKGEGKTAVSINLAAVLAERGKTCLVDGDLRGGMVASVMGLRAKSGLAQRLAGTETLESALVHSTECPNLTVLPVGAFPPNPADLVSSEAMQAVVITLRQEFAYIVIDSPPVIPYSDARVLSSLVDVVVLVSRCGLTTRRAMERAVQIFDEVRAPVAGVVLNDVNLASPDYQYYNYGYSRRMNEYGYYRSKEQGGLPPAPPGTGSPRAKGAHA
jgi:polysaccharide biosynthesis transport protein